MRMFVESGRHLLSYELSSHASVNFCLSLMSFRCSILLTFRSFHEFKCPFTQHLYWSSFGEASSGDDSVESITDLCEGEDNKIGGLDSSSRKHAIGNILFFLSKSCAVQHVNFLIYLCMAAMNMSIGQIYYINLASQPTIPCRIPSTGRYRLKNSALEK